MAMTLNTGHALYSNVKMLIGVESTNALVDLVTPSRTFTKHANAVYGSGTLGRHFGVRRAGYTAYGATFDSNFTPANNVGTLLIVTNAVSYGEYTPLYKAAFLSTNSSTPTNFLLPQIGILANTFGAGINAYSAGGGNIVASAATTTVVSPVTSPMMLTATRGSSSHALYVNGNTTPEVSGGALGTDGTAGYYSFIGGIDGSAPADFNLVWAVWFDVVLTPTQIADLYATLGASNAFGLVNSSSPATTTTLTGPGSGTNGVASTNFTVGANGSITGTLTVTPGDAANGGTFTPTSVAISSGTPTATFTYTPASTGTKTISITDNGGLTDATSMSYISNAAAATATTLTGPASGTTGVASTNFTVGANGTITGTVTVTPGDAANGGTFTPTTVAISSGTPTATFTYTPASTGVKTISITDNGGLTDATSLSYTSNAATDSIKPTMNGSITASGITLTGFTFSWPAGSDNVGVTGYEYSLDAGASYTDAGLVLTQSVTGRPSGTAHYVRVRDYDAAGNRADVPLSATITTLSATGTLTVTNKLKNNTATALASEAGVSVSVLKASDFTWVLNATCTTDSTGALSAIASTSLVPGTAYHVAIKTTLGGVGITAPVTAA